MAERYTFTPGTIPALTIRNHRAARKMVAGELVETPGTSEIVLEATGPKGSALVQANGTVLSDATTKVVSAADLASFSAEVQASLAEMSAADAATLAADKNAQRAYFGEYLRTHGIALASGGSGPGRRPDAVINLIGGIDWSPVAPVEAPAKAASK